MSKKLIPADNTIIADEAGNVTFKNLVTANGEISGSNLSGENTGDQDLSGYVPYTGADQNVELGANWLYIGEEGGTGIIITPDATTGDANGSAFSIGTGIGYGAGQGGELHFQSGAGGVNGDGGDITFIAGAAGGGDNDGGNINFETGGKSGSGINGVIGLRTSGSFAYLDISLITEASQTFTFPDATGTIALQSAISDTFVIGAETLTFTNGILTGVA